MTNDFGNWLAGFIAGYKTTKPSCEWRVVSKNECLQLVELLRNFPLRAKKKKDFLLWKDAVIDWNTNKKFGCRANNDWQKMAALKISLEKGRKFICA